MLEHTANKRLDPTRKLAVKGGMARRSTPQSKTDDLAFPVRVKVAIPARGLASLPAMYAWLRAEVGPGEYAHHGQPGMGGSTLALYFRSVGLAQRFVNAFPDASLADGVASIAYGSPYRSANPREEHE